MNPSVRQNLSLEETTPLSPQCSLSRRAKASSQQKTMEEGGGVAWFNNRTFVKRVKTILSLSFQTLKHETMKSAVVLGGWKKKERKHFFFVDMRKKRTKWLRILDFSRVATFCLRMRFRSEGT